MIVPVENIVRIKDFKEKNVMLDDTTASSNRTICDQKRKKERKKERNSKLDQNKEHYESQV